MINFLVGGVAAYGLVVGSLYLLQDGMLFPRAAATFPTFPLPAQTQHIVLEAPSGERLHGRLVKAGEASRGLLIAFPGNAWNADDLTVFLAHRVKDFDVAVFHYRGYAPSEGRPGELVLCEDALLVHDQLVERLRPQAVYVAGFSLGTGVAAYLASKRDLRGLLLVTPFDSIEAVARQRYFWAPVGPLLKHRFPSDRLLEGRDVPTAVIMAENDRVIPKERSEALVRVLERPVFVRTVPDATHNGIYDQELFDEFFLEALDSLDGARPPAEAGEEPPSPAEATATAPLGFSAA